MGERLINVDSSILNDPSFRAAGWTANNAEIKRTYSPPIPTAIASDYFSAPIRSAGFPPQSFGDDDEEGGMVTGKGSNDTIGPGPVTKRRRRREQHEEDDSSDLSDESDEDTEGTQRCVDLRVSYTFMCSSYLAQHSRLSLLKCPYEYDPDLRRCVVQVSMMALKSLSPPPRDALRMTGFGEGHLVR